MLAVALLVRPVGELVLPLQNKTFPFLCVTVVIRICKVDCAAICSHQTSTCQIYTPDSPINILSAVTMAGCHNLPHVALLICPSIIAHTYNFRFTAQTDSYHVELMKYKKGHVLDQNKTPYTKDE